MCIRDSNKWLQLFSVKVLTNNNNNKKAQKALNRYDFRSFYMQEKKGGLVAEVACWSEEPGRGDGGRGKRLEGAFETEKINNYGGN